MSLKIKSTGLAMITTMLLCILSPVIYAADTYEIDPVHSAVFFRIKHLGVSYTYGRFNQPEGYLRFDQTDPKNSAVEMNVKVANIDTDSEKRDNHLKSSDFFDSEKYPTISFISKSVEPDGSGKLTVKGELTLHGVTRPLTITALQTGKGKDPWGGYRIGFETTFSIKRSEFKMDTMQGAVGDDVSITVALEGIRK